MTEKEQTTVSTEQDDVSTEAGTEAEESTPSSREARYRIAAREARAEADALRATVAALQSAEVARLASARLADPTDLAVLGGVEVAALLDDEGRVDADLVEQAVSGLLEARPYLERDEVDGGGFDGGARQTVRQPSASWSALLSGRAR